MKPFRSHLQNFRWSLFDSFSKFGYAAQTPYPEGYVSLCRIANLEKISKKSTDRPLCKWLLGTIIYSLAALFLLFEMALQVAPSVMIQPLMYDFGINAMVFGVMVSFYFYSYTLMQIPVGLLFDRFSCRTLITLAIFICSIGLFFFGMTEHLLYAAMGRFFMGIGSSFAFVGVLVIAARWFPGRYFALLVGIAQMLAAVGALLGELPIAAFLTLFSWRDVIIALGAIGMILTAFSFVIIRDSPWQKHHIPHRHHLFKELREILKSGQTWWIALYAFFAWGPVMVFAALWGVPYLRVRFDVSVTTAAFAVAMVWVGIGITSPILGYLSDRWGRRGRLLTTCSSVGLICSSILIFFDLSFPFVFPLLLGIGMGAGGQILTFAVAKDNNRPSNIGTAVGLNNMAVVAGGALLQPLVGFILHCLWKGKSDHFGIPIYTLSNYHSALSIVPICFLAALLVSTFFIRETYCRSQFDPLLDEEGENKGQKKEE